MPGATATPTRGFLGEAAWRAWKAIAHLPVLADTPRLRWLLRGTVVGAPIVILSHRGRRSDRPYRTPVEAIVEQDGEIVVSPMRGGRGDWYRNALAGKLDEVTIRGASFRPQLRELSQAENRAALKRYLGAHPLYGRIVLWTLARGHRLRGRPLDAVAATIPMLALRPRGQLPGGR